MCSSACYINIEKTHTKLRGHANYLTRIQIQTAIMFHAYSPVFTNLNECKRRTVMRRRAITDKMPTLRAPLNKDFAPINVRLRL